jgi:catechol 2,3-dioxygenase-like lactoylglutathione lyase family enzyme
MNVEHITPILNVSSMAESFAWFEKLGWKKKWSWGDPPTFGAVGSGKVEIFLCKDGQGSRGGPRPQHPGDDDTGGVWMSWWVLSPAEVDATHARALEQGLTVTWPPTDEPWGVRELHLRHPDGHTFRVSAGLEGE